MEEIHQAKTLISQMPTDAVEAIVAEGCMFFKEEKYEDAKNKFLDAL